MHRPVLHELTDLVFVQNFVRHITTLPEIFQNYFTFNTDVHDYATRRNTELHHRLNGSSSPVLTATHHFYGNFA